MGQNWGQKGIFRGGERGEWPGMGAATSLQLAETCVAAFLLSDDSKELKQAPDNVNQQLFLKPPRDSSKLLTLCPQVRPGEQMVLSKDS